MKKDIAVRPNYLISVLRYPKNPLMASIIFPVTWRKMKHISSFFHWFRRNLHANIHTTNMVVCYINGGGVIPFDVILAVFLLVAFHCIQLNSTSMYGRSC